MSLDLDEERLKSWIGAERDSRDVISPRLARSLAAVLDEAGPLAEGDPAPAGIHWCLSPEIAPMSGLGPDGHPARGDFLPPVPLPRRMWAGGELRFSGDFRVGDEVLRRSRVEDVRVKTGRTGTLCFVAVRHEYSGPRGPVLSERHDIVYRALEAPTGGRPPQEPRPEPEERLTVEASPVLLMRYSAATFNGHRIHYDREYCLREEFYPGLVVHGPLQATYLLRMAKRMRGEAYPARFAFRGTSPLFDGPAFTVNGAREGEALKLWIADSQDAATMQATAE